MDTDSQDFQNYFISYILIVLGLLCHGIAIIYGLDSQVITPYVGAATYESNIGQVMAFSLLGMTLFFSGIYVRYQK